MNRTHKLGTYGTYGYEFWNTTDEDINPRIFKIDSDKLEVWNAKGWYPLGDVMDVVHNDDEKFEVVVVNT